MMLERFWQYLSRLLVVSSLLFTSLNGWAVNLEWDIHPESIDGYKLYRGYTPGNYDTIVDAGDVTTFEVTGLALEQDYYFAVTAYFSDDPVTYNLGCLGLDDPWGCCQDVNSGTCDEFKESGFSNEVYFREGEPVIVEPPTNGILSWIWVDPPIGNYLQMGEGYEATQLPDGRWLIIYDQLNAGDNVGVEY